jgi:hypothetical protein
MADLESRSSSSGAVRYFTAALTGLLGVLSLATTVAAQEDDFQIIVPISTVVMAPEGSETALSTTSTPDELVGETCEVTARSQNQSSVHPDNDLVVASNGSQITLHDVEALPGGVVTAADTLVLGEEIVITLIMGPDEVFSAGIEVRFQCPPPSTTTTEPTTTTTESITTSTAVTTTSTLASTTTTAVSATTLVPTTTEATTTTLAPTTSEVSTSTTIPDEVLMTTILPFTGSREGELGLFALALGAAGALLVVAARSREAATVTLFFSWDPGCARCERDAVFQTPHGRLCFRHTRLALYEDSKLWMPIRLDRRR